jgi:hypothetical protein
MSGEGDEEEAAALVASAEPPQTSVSSGVASIMVGLVFLALLIGFSRWINLDDNVSITLNIYFVFQFSMPLKFSSQCTTS